MTRRPVPPATSRRPTTTATSAARPWVRRPRRLRRVRRRRDPAAGPGPGTGLLQLRRRPRARRRLLRGVRAGLRHRRAAAAAASAGGDVASRTERRPGWRAPGRGARGRQPSADRARGRGGIQAGAEAEEPVGEAPAGAGNGDRGGGAAPPAAPAPATGTWSSSPTTTGTSATRPRGTTGAVAFPEDTLAVAAHAHRRRGPDRAAERDPHRRSPTSSSRIRACRGVTPSCGARPEGTWVVVDEDSTNGTWVDGGRRSDRGRRTRDPPRWIDRPHWSIYPVDDPQGMKSVVRWLRAALGTHPGPVPAVVGRARPPGWRPPGVACLVAVTAVESSARRISENNGPVLVASQRLVASLAEADAAATASFLAGGEGDREQLQGLRGGAGPGQHPARGHRRPGRRRRTRSTRSSRTSPSTSPATPG